MQPLAIRKDRYRCQRLRSIRRDRNSGRKTEESPVTYSKFWSQDSPTKPCAPYNIDCINPLLVEEETIPRLIIVEGEKMCWY